MARDGLDVERSRCNRADRGSEMTGCWTEKAHGATEQADGATEQPQRGAEMLPSGAEMPETVAETTDTASESLLSDAEKAHGAPEMTKLDAEKLLGPSE